MKTLLVSAFLPIWLSLAQDRPMANPCRSAPETRRHRPTEPVVVVAAAQSESVPDEEPAETDPPVVQEVGPAIPADTYGRDDGSLNPQEEPQTQDLPAEFDVLLSLFDLDGFLAIGYGPFDPPGNNCLEARYESSSGQERVAVAALTPGVICDSFSLFSTSATPGELLICTDVLFLKTELPTTALEDVGSSLIATVTAPALPDGVNWIGGTIEFCVWPQMPADTTCEA